MSDSQVVLVAEGAVHPGQPTVIEGPSHCTRFAAVFEDDGDTGYFYALDTKVTEQPILDALHVYNALAVADRARASQVQIVWSATGYQVLLLINDFPHAAFDFSARRGYCRTGFPPPMGTFSAEGHAWSDNVLQHFRPDTDVATPEVESKKPWWKLW